MKALRYILTMLTAMIWIHCHGTIITVKQDGTGDFSLIQDAIDAASDGDTVLVWPGRYFENVDFSGKNITLASLMLTTGDPAYRYSTIIDGNYSGSCVNLMSGETDAVLYGLSLQHGSGNTWTSQGVGGGVNIAYARCSIQYCDISKNLTYGHGGGIFIAFSAGTQLKGTSIHHNHTYGSGGGIVIGNSAIVYFDSMDRCNLYENFASQGCDLRAAINDTLHVYLDTCTVLYPDSYFFSSTQQEGYQVDNIIYSIWNATITPKDADLYVNPQTGDNSNSGLTPDEPLKSIAYAYSSIVVDSTDKNTIYLADGIYSDSANNEKFPLNIRPYINVVGQSRDLTILDGRYKCSLIIGNKEVSDYSFRKMTMRQGGSLISQGFTPTGSAFFYAQNNNILLDSILFTKGLGFSGFSHLGIEASNNVLVSNCEFSDNIGAYAIRTGQQRDTIRIRNCIFRDNKPDSSQQWAWGGAMILISFETDTYIENCLFTGNNNYNVGAFASFTDQGNHYFINCTFTGNTKLSPNASLGTRDANTFIYNSIFYDDNHAKPIHLSWHEAVDTITLGIYHSLIENGEPGVYIKPGGPTKFIYDDSNISGNPLFDTTGSYPFGLAAGSPCIDAGTPLWYSGVDYPYLVQEDSLLFLHINENKVIELSNIDLAGNPRVYGNSVDMGAYEHGPWVSLREPPNSKFNIQHSKLLMVSPNPFRYGTYISYIIIEKGLLNISVYSLSGLKVKTLASSQANPGDKGSFYWDGSDQNGQALPASIYLIRMTLDGKELETARAVKQ
ncbi:MAG: DUF1565 domain-containing protein [Bacteroidales bacterium]